MLKNKKTLLLILGALVATKWVILPIFEWQNQKLDELSIAYALLQKSEDAIRQQNNYLARASAIKSELKKGEGYFFANTDNIRLQIQRELEELWSRYNVSVKGFQYLDSSIENENSKLTKYIMDIDVEGNIFDFIEMHQALSQLETTPRFYITEFNLSSKRRRDDIVNFRGNLIVQTFSVNKEIKDNATQ